MMAEVLLPTWIIPEEETHEWLDEGSSVFAAAFAPGLAQRQSYGGLRLKLSRRHTVRGEEKAQLLSILQSTRGRFNALRTKVHFALRGSGFGTELLSNNTFANGTTGWTANATATLSVNDRVARVASNGAGAQPDMRRSSAVSVTQYAPYVVRAAVSAMRFDAPQIRSFFNDGTLEYSSTSLTTPGLASVAAVPMSASLTPVGSFYTPGTGHLQGTFFDVSYMSLSRCALVDNAGNALVRSDEFDNASWTKSELSVVANYAAAPDGTTTADNLVPSTNNTTHSASRASTVSSAAADYSFACAFKRNGYNFMRVQMREDTGSTVVYQNFNLLTGTIGSTSASGANWSNLRSFIVPLGNDWFYCCIVARKTNAATDVAAFAIPQDADSIATFAGNGTSGIGAWRATLAQSSVPPRLVQTTSAASTGTSQTGNALHVKGLPASTNGLLLPGDYFEINGEIKQATAALNSDAAGLGYLQFEPALIRSPANDDPVVITDPFGKFLVSNIKIENQFGTQATVTYDLEHVYE